MPSQAIKSPFIKSVSHHANALTIELKKGTRYRYMNAPMAHYVALCNSKTPGRYYREKIKGKYHSKKLNKNEA